jgi:hypothetical protein
MLIIIDVWCSSNLKKSALNSHYYLQRAVTPDQITQQNSLHAEGRRALQAVQAI